MTTVDFHRRVVIEHVRPVVECGRFPAKAAVGLPVEVVADVLADGHDELLAWVRHGAPAREPARTAVRREETPMRPLGNDRWTGRFAPTRMGCWEFEIVALPDEFGTWLRDLRRRVEAGQDVALEIEEGALMAERRLDAPGLRRSDATGLQRLLAALRSPRSTSAAIAAAGTAAVTELMRRTADRERATVAGPFPLWVDRELGARSAWYEMFPRSEGAQPPRSGTLATAARRLPAIAAMGFDIVYLPPIHPIGSTHRKGADNALEATAGDPGSPWAIGGEAGGHDAVHPDLGDIRDVDAFVESARACGLEVALDYALQCSPDHPWVREHPDWFRHRPDGSIRHAENPPKRYQDIFPIDFGTADAENLYRALLDIVLFWVSHGIRVFRVDNPHTKPLRFWDRLIADVHSRHPDVLFLAEAFTRPRVMERLAKGGFTQSYTYFTWRNSKWELEQYLRELSSGDMVDYFRPNFWPNTPDILHEVLQKGGPAAFRMRLLLAALCAPSWGMYSGYELFENTPVREGSEEYLHSEKYQFRPRRWDTPDSLAPMVTQVNAIRRRHAEAIALLRTLRIHHADSEAILCVSRMDDAREDVLLLLVNLDPFGVHEATTWLDLDALGIPGDQPFEAHDELTGDTYVWQGPANYVRLDPAERPGHVLHLRRR